MAYNALNNLIDAYIYPNGVQAITGSILNNVLKAMVSQLGGGYNLMGVAAPASSPAVNDEPQAYFAATAGTYTNFDGIVLAAGEVAVLLTSGNGSWSKQTIYNVPTGTADLANTAGFITSAVNSLVNYYTKTEIDTALSGYTTTAALATALADYYNKAAIDAQMATRYTKTEVDTKFGDYYRKAETYDKDEVDSIVAALSRQEYIVAWDGSSAPVVADIPAGVTVTYSGTPYTGTLAASASTLNKIYMVWNGTAYDMYGTSQDGGYSWVPMGTTTVDLSQYATKAELAQLEHKVDEINLTSDLGTDGDDTLSFVDENDNCILQAKDGHIKTKDFDSRDVITETDLNAFADTVALKDKGANPTSELAIVDENDECIAQFKDGHIQTKDFNSRDVMAPDNEDEDDSALAFVDENNNAVAQFKDGHIKTKYFDSRDFGRQESFAYIGIDKLSVSGTSTKADGQITLAPGVANRAYLMNGFECAHWEMSAKFICSGGVSFVMGKDLNTYGAWLEIKLDNGVSRYTFFNNGTSSQYSGNFDFSLSIGEEYTLRLFFNVTTTKILGFEIFGQYNEYFTHTFDNVTCNGYGNPFFYSDNTCTVKEFSLSNQNYYDIKNAKASVWGHSYVEGDSLGPNRDKTFTNLLANAIGADKVFNFGLGGDNWLGVYHKMGNEMGIVSNIQYGLVCCGANDSNLSLADTKSRITDIVNLLQNNNIIPIIFTIAPIDPSKNGSWYNQMFVEANAWIRQNFLYVDMEQVFLDVDATGTWNASNVKTSLYLSDLIHPNVDGHAAIFRRIQMDCPYLF